MKIVYRKFKGMDKAASSIERSLRNLTSKYGFELVRYVANQIFEHERSERKLREEIKKKETELAELKRKHPAKLPPQGKPKED